MKLSSPVYNRPFAYAPPQGLPPIIFNDAQLIAIDKPAGLLSVPGKTSKDSALVRVRAVFDDALLIHRLDLATSGVMLFPRGPKPRRHIARQFERRYITKRYIALVAGHLEGAGEVDLPLRCDWPNRPMQRVDFEAGKPALTRWETLGHETVSGFPATRVALRPVTGRSHQLRVHCRELGHPILGDRLYAPDAAFGASERLCLHAESLAFRHPEGGTETVVRAEVGF